MEPRHLVGENIRRLRKERDFTQEELAHRAGLHPVELGRAERGIRDLRLSTLVRIARGLDVAAADLLYGIR